MPEHDFELYLSLLSRFLRLKPAQHAEIADELRDHLEQRLEEFSARGLSHDEAIRKALDEFGDAAELANHFTRAIHIRRRRLIMRCTMGTVAALAATLLVATAFWPATPHSPIALNAVAENPPAPVVPAVPGDNAQQAGAALPPGEKWGFLHVDNTSERIHAKLDNPTEVTFLDQPLEEAINFLRDFHQVNIWIDRATLSDEGIQLDVPVTLQVSGVSFRSTLKLLLDPIGLTYVVEDEVMKVTTPSKATNVIAVYNIRDVLGPQAANLDELARRERLSFGMVAVDQDSNNAVPEKKHSAKSSSASRKQKIPTYSTSSLAVLVTQTIAPDTWIEAGGDGSAIQYNGVLVVRNSQVVHEKVRSFLKLLRSTLDE
jgi:hypothetical protein